MSLIIKPPPLFFFVDFYLLAVESEWLAIIINHRAMLVKINNLLYVSDIEYKNETINKNPYWALSIRTL